MHEQSANSYRWLHLASVANVDNKGTAVVAHHRVRDRGNCSCVRLRYFVTFLVSEIPGLVIGEHLD